uniref:DUF21 domain-containing protein At4g33700-like n=1 Tax=Styela clava TaxID=7725 RepID=UPI0019398C1E|nr:DUF21 domain-containing protein At4g33700-like [Styela clava]
MLNEILLKTFDDGKTINCIVEGHKLNCSGIIYVEEEDPLTYTDKWFWIYLGIYVGLVLIAGLVSGLTMGLLSLDMLSLNVLASGGKPKERKYAKKIIPLVKRHHLLLVTLLLTNAAAVESMPLFLDRISDPVTAIVVSVTAVLIFGEVLPQALCTRFGLAIGSALSPVVKFLMLITLPISWPLSKFLDCILGGDHSTFFRRAELSILVDLHQQLDAENEDPLSKDEVMIIKGALSMRDKLARQAYTPIEKLFALNIDGVMDEQTMEEILNTGHSRIPVYEGDKNHLLGILLVKRLIKLDPDEKIPIREVFQKEKRDLPRIVETAPLFDLLNQFQMGRSHMCCVTSSDDADMAIGIITLEDVIEELIQEEILDETDLDVMRRLSIAGAIAVRRRTMDALYRGASPRNSPRDGGWGETIQETDEEEYADVSDSDTRALIP